MILYHSDPITCFFLWLTKKEIKTDTFISFTSHQVNPPNSTHFIPYQQIFFPFPVLSFLPTPNMTISEHTNLIKAVAGKPENHKPQQAPQPAL